MQAKWKIKESMQKLKISTARFVIFTLKEIPRKPNFSSGYPFFDEQAVSSEPYDIY